MKVTKGNISKVLGNAGVRKSVVSRGRVCSGITEGFGYHHETPVNIQIAYYNRSSSYLKREIWIPIWEEQIQKIFNALIQAGFNAEIKENFVVVNK